MFVLFIWVLSACAPHPPLAPIDQPPIPTSTVASTSSPSPAPTTAPTSTSSPSPAPTTTLTSTLTPLITLAPTQLSHSGCQLSPIKVPTLPAVIPHPNQLDVTTGLHMTGTVQKIDLADYSLKINGLVDHPLELSYDDLRCMPKVTLTTSINCGFFSDKATWSGVPLNYIFEKAGIRSDAASIELYSADGYMAQVSLEDAMYEKNFLAYEWQGKPLPILHGFPLRAIFPLISGNASVKWLTEINVK